MQRKQRMVWWSVSGLTGAALMILGLSLSQAQPLKTASKRASKPAPTNSVTVKAKAPKTDKPGHTKDPVIKKRLTGAELYSMNCNRCHQERYPTERTGAQWKTIMLHMQVRANIPVSQAKLILQFLQENSGR